MGKEDTTSDRVGGGEETEEIRVEMMRTTRLEHWLHLLLSSSH